MRAVTRDELEPMMIVARWLKERTPDDGRLVMLSRPTLDPLLLGGSALEQPAALRA